jgi:cell division protein FtsL
MAKNRRTQAAEIRFGPVIKVVFLCLLIGGSAIGYVWQKNQIARLGDQITELDKKVKAATKENQVLADQVAILKSPVKIDRRVKELKLGLAPAQPQQMVWLTNQSARGESNAGELVARRLRGGTP